MRILVATSAFYPENSPRSFRASELTKELTRQGHEVTVVTKNHGNECVNFCKENSIILKRIAPSLLPAIKVSSSKYFNLITRAISRTLLILFEYPDIELAYRFKQALRNLSGYDLLISEAVPYPLHWGVAWAWREQTARCWIADCGDPYMGNESDSFKKLFYFKYIEKWMFRKVNYIAIPIESAKSAYYIEFHSKVVIIPQGLNFSEYRNDRLVYSRHTIPTFAYAGSFIPGKRDPSAFLGFLINLETEFRFYIYTSTPQFVIPFAERSKGRVVVLQTIPRKDLIAILSRMDFLVNIDNSTATQAPSKLIDYFLTDRPVLTLSSYSIHEEKILKFLKFDFRDSLVFNGYDRFQIENVANRFLALIPNSDKIPV
jgi:hypothetical protein